MIISSSIEDFETENNKRLNVLFRKHNEWLMACSYNNTKDLQLAQDFVQDLYLYLAEKKNPKIFYKDSFNLLYCHNFMKSRYINWIKRENKTTRPISFIDVEDVPYDIDYDIKIQQSYDTIINELENLKKTNMWSSAKLYEMYAFTDVTMEELSGKIGISKSTTFLNIKKIKEHIKKLIENPFKEESYEY